MKNRKMLLILLITLLIVLIVCIILVVKIQPKETQPQYNIVEDEGVIEEKTDGTFKTIKNKNDFYTIKNILETYTAYIKQINGDQYLEIGKLDMTEAELKSTLQKEGIQAIKGVLDKQYIQEMTVTDDKIVSLQSQYKQKGNYENNVDYNLQIKNIYYKDINTSMTIFLVKAKMVDKDFDIIIKLDRNNKTYSIFLENYLTKYQYNENMKEQDIQINQDRIDNNGYNKYIAVQATESYIISQYFSDYRMKMLKDTQTAYQLLETNYSKAKYNNYNTFKTYVENNKNQIQYASIQSYQTNEYDGKQEYVCIDNNGKYYIFTENGVGRYTVVLDTYTVDLPEFLEKYNKNSDEIKVGLNIQKVFDAINDGDYGYAYNKLDSTFRANNFKNKEAFETYVKANFYTNNTIKHNQCQKNGNVYVYEITITDTSNTDKKGIEKTIIMQLKEGTDFVMSFNIK